MMDLKELETRDTAADGAGIMEKFEKESRTRSFTSRGLQTLVYVLCLVFTLYHLAYASGITPSMWAWCWFWALPCIRLLRRPAGRRWPGTTGSLLHCAP